MALQAANFVLWIAAGYLAVGALLALVALTQPLARIEKGATGVGLAVRAVFVPGMVLLWPLLAGRILQRSARNES